MNDDMTLNHSITLIGRQKNFNFAKKCQAAKQMNSYWKKKKKKTQRIVEIPME